MEISKGRYPRGDISGEVSQGRYLRGGIPGKIPKAFLSLAIFFSCYHWDGVRGVNAENQTRHLPSA